MKISLILAVGRDNEIALNGDLPWKSKEDLKTFKNITSNQHILMGYNTFLTIVKPLPNRVNIVVSFKKIQIDGCLTFTSIEEAIEHAKKQKEEELFIIGGASIYKYFAENNLIDRVYLTHMIY